MLSRSSSRQRAWLFLISVIIISALQGCGTTVTRDDAATTALQFVQERVRFFPEGGNSASLVTTDVVVSPDSYEEGDAFVILLHAEATLDERTVKNDFIIEVDKRSGQVTSVNGQPVPPEN